MMASLEAKYTELTGVKTLKVRHNNILGFFVEVTHPSGRTVLQPGAAAVRH